MKNLLKKIELYGEKSLSDLELLYLLCGKNNIEKVFKLYNDMCVKNCGLMLLGEITIKDIMNDYYFSKSDALKLKAYSEFSRRYNKPIVLDKKIIKSAEDINKIFSLEFRYEKNEILKLVVLNNKNIIKRIVEITNGKQDSITFDIKSILLETIKTGFNKIILVHNHPSGDSKPSNDDIAVTNKIKEISEMMGIKLLDHIIIGDNEYTSILYG